jgi:tetratricopeptide (TPR) repeat protein
VILGWVKPGSLFNERFEIERRAGSGGMSIVFRARDVTSGEICAIKLLTGEGARQLERFDREGRVLAELRHPAIVRYVDHGVTGEGERYLAMEWLEGEDLSERLARAPLTINEALVLARVVAEALGVAHARGVVHRDIKPSNLFLPDGRIDRVKILDFGIARLVDDSAQPTRTGVRVGTPAYMSPEQARGLSTIDARTDVFSLGCVLYQCLTGVKPFSGDDVLAVLAKILLEEPQPVDRLRIDAPASLSELIGKMIAKAPEARPKDGATVAAEAARIASEVSPVGRRRRSATTTGPPPALTVRERRVVSVVAAHDPDAATRADELHAAIERAAPGAGLRVEALKNGTIVVAVTGTDVATDLAARAARVALAMRAASRGPVALATGRADVSAELPVGEVIERVSRLLRAAAVSDSDDTLDLHAGPRPGTPGAILVDETTAGLLDARFAVSGDERGLALVGERAAVDTTRTLLGRPTPCVGREPELAALEAAYAACEGGEARAVLITAPAGVGKSRVRYELLRRLAARDPAPPRVTDTSDAPVSRAPEVWIARGDPLSAGAALGLLGAALRRAAGILDGEADIVRQRKLRARVARHVAPADAPRVAEFLGELIGTPFADDESVQLRAARRDAMLLGDQMRRAWEDFLAAECAARPVVIVIEDLQWGDAPTVSFLDAALRRLREAPLLVVALARPEVHEQFPRLWVDRGVQQIRLGDLPRKAAERLAREVLGAKADAAAVTKIVERAGGNAFYLEELLRATADGHEDLPETVLTMVQARLERMEGEARRILRAASVFGEAFWTGGVATLLGGASQTTQVGEWLRELAAREVVSSRPSSRFPGEQEHVFRHAIVREAAYAMLTDGDRALGHRLAGAWLTKIGEPSATVLAEHFERGGEPSAAVDWWRRAAEQALGANDLPAVLAAVARGVACGAAGSTLGALRLYEAEAHNWRAEYGPSAEAAEQATRWLPRGGDAWYAALDQLASALFSLGERERLLACARELGTLDASRAAPLRTAARMIPSLIYAGAPTEAAQLWPVFDGLPADAGVRDPALVAAIMTARGAQAIFDGDSEGMLDHNRASIPLLERAGDLRRVQRARGTVGYCALELGAFADAITALRETLETSTQLGLQAIAQTARQNLGMALCYAGALDEARTEQSKSVQEFVENGNRRMEVASRYYLGYIRMVAGDLAGAEKSARAAVEMALGPPLLPPVRAEGLGILAAILLAQGRPAEALESAREAHRLLEELGGIDGGEPMIRLALAEALHATGDAEAAARAIGAAYDRLRARADKIRDPALRASFLEAIPENARTAALAAAWCRT